MQTSTEAAPKKEEVSARAEKLEMDPDFLTTEDCQYLLRALEKQAFKHVVCALRAQGPLTQYREVILDHLKSILFISEEDYQVQLRISSADPILTRIAEELNPSYDTCSEWAAAAGGLDLLSLELPNGDLSKHVVQNGSKGETQQAAMLREMVREMDDHNARLGEERLALLKLLQLPKKPYVPEKLRRLLQQTERDTNGRVDAGTGAVGSKADRLSHRRAAGGKISKLKRGVYGARRESKFATKDESDIKQSVALLLSNASSSIEKELQQQQQQHNGETSSSENGNVSSMSSSQKNNHPDGKRTASSKSQQSSAEFPIHRQGTNNVVVVDPEEQFSREPRVRKRRMKHLDDGTYVCARVMPFVFEPAQPGALTKPVRGNPNPDKRWFKFGRKRVLDDRLLKRTSPFVSYPPMSSQENSIPRLGYEAHQHVSTIGVGSVLGSYYSRPFGYNAELHLQHAKRIRTASQPEGGDMLERTALRCNPMQTVVMPKMMLTPTATPLINIPTMQSPPTRVQAPSIYSQTSTVVQHAHNKPPTAVIVQQSRSTAPGYGYQRAMDGSIEALSNNQGSIKALPNSSDACVAAASFEPSGLDFLASISTSLLTPHPIDTAADMEGDHQPAPENNKIQAETGPHSCVEAPLKTNPFHPLVDRQGVPIDQETTTLGTILADPTLRKEFLSAAVSRQQQLGRVSSTTRDQS